ncbi:MAG: PHP domain-containing protein [Clostridia bacterium]|nr:PHP domain-containing protein [Clostridia bacterium]
MNYVVDNDLHIHSYISSCSKDPGQTTDRILRYAKENGLNTICLTDHFWDETVEGASEWYSKQDYGHIEAAKPLPQSEGIRFLFGCEIELNRFLTLGLSKERYDLFDFILIPTTHFHMKGYTLSEDEISSAANRAKAWVKRFAAVLDMDLPFHKVGIAHLTCGLIAPTREEYLEVLRLIPEDEMKALFSRAAKLGVGIELNACDMNFKDDEADTVLKIYRIAKECGCKFYLGSDAHRSESFSKAKGIFEKAVTLLELTEEDKFILK